MTEINDILITFGAGTPAEPVAGLDLPTPGVYDAEQDSIRAESDPPPTPIPPAVSGWRPARVLKTYYDCAAASITHWSGDRRAIDCMAITHTTYDDSKSFDGTTFIGDVLPDEDCVDQALHHVAVADTVWVGGVPGEQHYYRTHFEPFFGRVTVSNSSDVTVRWQRMAGDPDDAAFNGASLSDLAGSPSGTGYFSPRPGATVSTDYWDFKHVKPLSIYNGMQHGLVASSTVLVMQRGRYLFCLQDDPGVPVGTVLSWWGDPTSPPGGYSVCDGSTVTDVLSPFYDQVLPDLQGKSIFGYKSGDDNFGSIDVDKGVLAAPDSTGGHQTLEIEMHLVSDLEHTHAGTDTSNDAGTLDAPLLDVGTPDNWTAASGSDATAPVADHRMYTLDGPGANGTGTEIVSGSGVNASHVNRINILPPFATMIFIMRIR